MIKKSHNLSSGLCQKLHGHDLNSDRNSEVQAEENTYNYLTVAQVAEKLQVSKDYVRTLVKNGHLESIKLPGGPASPIRISLVSFLSLLDNSKDSRQNSKQDIPKPKRQRKAYYGVFSA